MQISQNHYFICSFIAKTWENTKTVNKIAYSDGKWLGWLYYQTISCFICAVTVREKKSKIIKDVSEVKVRTVSQIKLQIK